MTLITNELNILNGLNDCYWISAADRRLTSNGQFHSNRQKLFPIKYLNATVSFFGLAIYKTSKEYYISDILKKFITDNNTCATLDEFALRLQCYLNKTIPSNLLKMFASGFHICGFNDTGLPHFIHISNVNRMDKFNYLDLQASYKKPFCDFLDRDAKDHFHWDGINSQSAENGSFIYRNGDISTHSYMSKTFDELMKDVFTLPSFLAIKDYQMHADYVKFKFNFIASLYDKWSTEKIIGKPIDIFVLTKDKIIYKKNKRWVIL